LSLTVPLRLWRSSKEKNMRFWLMDHVMHPTETLLDTKSPPLLFRRQVSVWYLFGEFSR
ncbi:hypothetical protein LEMLEM_LOCUS24029, partial [Lemmus lemmus]